MEIIVAALLDIVSLVFVGIALDVLAIPKGATNRAMDGDASQAPLHALARARHRGRSASFHGGSWIGVFFSL